MFDQAEGRGKDIPGAALYAWEMAGAPVGPRRTRVVGYNSGKVGQG